MQAAVADLSHSKNILNETGVDTLGVRIFYATCKQGFRVEFLPYGQL